jgi:hypothetical protein
MAAAVSSWVSQPVRPASMRGDADAVSTIIATASCDTAERQASLRATPAPGYRSTSIIRLNFTMRLRPVPGSAKSRPRESL